MKGIDIMSKEVIKILGPNERSEKIEKLLSEKLIVGEPESDSRIKGSEDRKYLLLYYFSDEKGEEDQKSFEFIIGRMATYKFIKSIIEDINIHKSKVLVETVTLNELISVYEFMKHISSIIEDDDKDSFDIEDYNTGDYDDEV